MPVTDEELVAELRQILKDVDMETTTERKIRQALETHFNEELTSKKQLISEEVISYLAELETQGDIDDDDEGGESGDPPASDQEAKGKKRSKPDAPVKKKRKASTSGGNPLSPELSAFLGGVEIMQRTQVVKRLWEYIKDKNLQDPAKKSRIIPDEKMLTLFKPPLDQLNMNKQLSKHILPKDPNAPPAQRRPKKAKTDGENGETKRESGLQKPLRVSPELGDWLGGVTEASRAQLTSHFWKYVKANGLQDPADKRNIIADTQLQQLTGEERFAGFGFMKFFSPHFLAD